MDARIRGFIQRTKRTISFPFKVGRQKSTLLNSSSRHSELHSNHEGPVTPPVLSRPSEDFYGEPKPILEDGRSAGPRLCPSAHNPSEPQHSLENARETFWDGVQYKDSPGRVFVHNDGFGAFFALLLDEDLVVKQREILGYCRKRNHLKRRLANVIIEVTITQGKIDYTKESIEETVNDERSTTLQKDLELEQQKFHSICQKRDALKWDLDILEINLEYLRNQSQTIFEEALRAANMLNDPELDDESITSVQDPTDHDQPSAAISVQSSSTGISMEHTFGLALLEELERKGRRFHFMRDAFNKRNEDLDKDTKEYEEAVQDGTCDLSRSDFDCMGLEMLQARTRDYIDAEIGYEEVKTRARALRLLENDFFQDSNFIDDPDDGYRESFEVATMDRVDEEFIKGWRADIINSQEEMGSLDEQLEADDWEAKTIGISDSISVVDYTRNGARIKRWQDICRLAQEAHAENSADCT
ncbi:hypothetical protein MMC22_003664 [Lobaria immixta]|nr:hypothetical protein [Lobaria immixta]